MRVLIVHPGPNFSVSDVFDGLAKGLRQNGCEVAMFNLDDRLEFYSRAHIKQDDETFVQAFSQDAAATMASVGLEAACYRFWPDVIVVVSGFFIPPAVWGILARRPHHVVYWATESPYEDDRQARPGRYADTVILNDPTNLDSYREQINTNTHYLPHSYDPDKHHPGPGDPDLACDFGFVGTGFQSRIDFFERVDWDGIHALFGGNWRQTDKRSVIRSRLAHGVKQCMNNDTTADLYRSCKVSANLYRKEHSEQANADGWAMGPREVELAACGTFFLREPRPEGDELFPFLPTFTEPDEFSELVRWYVKHDTAREMHAERAREAIADRTFKNHAAELLRIVERAGTKIAA